MSGVSPAQYPWRNLYITPPGLSIDSPESGLVKCINFDFVDGKIVTRKGFVKAGAYGMYVTVDGDNDGILSIFQYDSTNGRIFLFTHDDKIRKFVGGTDPLEFTSVATLTGGTGFTDDSYWRWASLNNWAVAVCSDDAIFTNGTTVYTLGIPGPSAAPSLAASSSGSLTAGDYQVSYSYVRSGAYGGESTKSPVGTVTVATNEKIDVTTVASTNAQVDKINIFVTGPGGTIEYFQTQVANASTTYSISSVVTAATPGYGDLGLAPEDFGLPPQAADHLVVAGNRMWYGISNTSIVWRSDEGQPEVCRISSFDFFGKGDGTNITGLGFFGDDLVVFKQTKIFIQNIWSFSIVVFEENKGCIAPLSIRSVSVGGVRGVIFLSNRHAVEMFVGNGVISLTDGKMTRFFRDILDTENVSKVRSAYHPGLKRYTIVIPIRGGGYREFCYFFSGPQQGDWSEYSKPYPGATEIITDAEGSYWLLTSYQNDTVAYFYLHDQGGLDDDSNIRFSLKTGYLNYGLPGIQKTFRRVFMDAILFGYGQTGVEDSDLYGYLFTARRNDKIVVAPYSTGSGSGSSEQVGYEILDAFDGSESTEWRSEEGADNGIRVGVRLDVIDVLVGEIGGPLIYVSDYGGGEYIQWAWATKSYDLKSFKVVPSGGGVKNFLVTANIMGGGSEDWVTLFTGTCSYGIPFSASISSTGVLYEKVRLTVLDVYDGGTAKVKIFNVTVKEDVPLSGYILSKEPGIEIRKAWFDYYSEMSSFISTWKTNNPTWATSYDSGEVSFDIDDNESISSAIGFVSEAALNASTMVEVSSDQMLQYNIGNNIFLDFPDGEGISCTLNLYADENRAEYATREVLVPASNNYIVDDQVIIERSRVDVFGKMETFSFEIEFDSSYGMVVRGFDIWFVPIGLPDGEEND